MECNFVSGQRVVCIKDSWTDINLLIGQGMLPDNTPVPPLNSICKILAIAPLNKILGKIRVHVEPEPIMLRLQGYESWYTQEAFRPLQERPKDTKIDISIFYPLLDTSKIVTKEPV